MTPATRLPYASAADSNSTSMEGREKCSGASHGQRKRMFGLDEEVIARRREVQRAGRNRLLVFSELHPWTPGATQDLMQNCARILSHMHDNRHCRRKTHGQMHRHLSQRIDGPGGTADHHQNIWAYARWGVPAWLSEFTAASHGAGAHSAKAPLVLRPRPKRRMLR